MRTKKKKKSSWLKRVLVTFFVIILIPVLAAAALLGYLTYTEFSPEDVEILSVSSGAEKDALDPKKIFTVMTWNIGYGDLGEDSDFFLDGGSNVINSSEDVLDFNVTNIASQIRYQHPEILFLQEVDLHSRRSHDVDEIERIKNNLDPMDFVFAENYKSEFVPYPWPPIGWVDSGIVTASASHISTSERHKLAESFDWPKSLINLKRCISVSRIPIEGKENELVAINLHLETYDNGSVRDAQVEILRTLMEKEYEAGNYVIAGGNFNEAFSPEDISKYPIYEGNRECRVLNTADFGDRWQFVMDNEVPTCRLLDKPYKGADKETFQYYMLDGFIISDNIRLVEVETKDMGFSYSDHNPVVIKVKLT